MRKRFSIFCMFAFLVAAMAFCATPAFAAKKIAVSTNTNWKKAPEVKSGKTYSVSGQNDSEFVGSYLKFTAKKKGTYKFSVSNFKMSKKSKNGAAYNINFFKQNPKKAWNPSPMTIKTKGGEAMSLCCCDKTWYSKNKPSGKITEYTNLMSRSTKISLKKNQTVYLEIYQTDTAKYSFDMKIKKVN